MQKMCLDFLKRYLTHQKMAKFPLISPSFIYCHLIQPARLGESAMVSISINWKKMSCEVGYKIFLYMMGFGE